MTEGAAAAVAFEAAGKVYSLRFTIDSIVQLEALTGRPFPALSADLMNPEKATMTLTRQLFWAALQDRHPEIDLKEAGELMLAAGGMAGALTKVAEAFKVSFAPTVAARPPKPGRTRKAGSAH